MFSYNQLLRVNVSNIAIQYAIRVYVYNVWQVVAVIPHINSNTFQCSIDTPFVIDIQLISQIIYLIN